MKVPSSVLTVAPKTSVPRSITNRFHAIPPGAASTDERMMMSAIVFEALGKIHAIAEISDPTTFHSPVST